MEIGTCEISKEELIRVLETERTFTLATSADNHVTIRPMSHINDGLALLFQTGADSLKMRQIYANPSVALCVGAYQLEGTAMVLGHPLAKENAFFAKAYQDKHPLSFKSYSAGPEEVVVRVAIHRARQWRYIDGKPFIAKADGLTPVQSRCGLLCDGCAYKESHGCAGCVALNGNPFWGECPVAACCQAKGYEHCGQCGDIPCDTLRDFSCGDSEHSDKPAGARIAVCRAWAREA